MSKRQLSTSVKEGLKQSDQDQECGSKIFYVPKALLSQNFFIAVSVRYSLIIDYYYIFVRIQTDKTGETSKDSKGKDSSRKGIINM